MATKGPPWTAEERERLVALKADGLKHAAIAAALGRPVGAVTGELYNLRHPGRQEAIHRAYRERKGDGYKAMQAEHYRSNRPRLIAEHRAYYAAKRERVLARQAERRAEQPERLREIRRASNARNRAARNEGNNMRAAVAKARRGDGRHLGTLTGLSADDALFWLPRLPVGCAARAIVDKLRAVAEVMRSDRDGDANWRVQYGRQRDAWQAAGGDD